MTQSERTRFTILFIVLIVVVVAGVAIDRFRNRGSINADELGTVLNQAVATYKDVDGIDMQPTLSDVSEVTVSSGVNTVTMSYSLQARKTQSANFDLQFFNPEEDKPLTTVPDKKAQNGSLSTKVKNVPNGYYDISAKPLGFLSQSSLNKLYQNGKTTALEFKSPFLWGDIDVSFNKKGDNTINNADWVILSENWEIANPDPRADVNQDGKVNNIDASVMLNNWTKEGDRFTYEVADEDQDEVPEL